MTKSKKGRGPKIKGPLPFLYEYDFKRPIGKTVDGKPLTKVRVARYFDQVTGKFIIASIYPIE